MAQRLAELGADAIGVNCADGPAGVYEMATRMLEVGLPVVAQPNAGLPRRLDGRFAYMATPEYFQVYARRLFKAGVQGVGGCCGTTAEHVREISQAARMMRGDVPPRDSTPPEAGDQATRDLEVIAPSEVAPGITITPLADKGHVGACLASGRFIVSVEVNPPPGLSLERALAGAAKLKAGGVDAINVPDGARATARMGNIALCHRIQEQLGIPALMHVTTRDRNMLGLVAHLLSAHELGVDNLVVITGDPPKMGDFPDATAVYDVDSIGLLRLIDGLNRGFDPGGKPLSSATSFLCATGAEPAASDYERELLRLEDKRDAPSRSLSGGMKRRLLVAKALTHRPRLLFLDEPTAGVDAKLRRHLFALVRRLRDEGTTIVLTTHHLEEAEALADRVAILHRGRVIHVSPLEALLEEADGTLEEALLGRVAAAEADA